MKEAKVHAKWDPDAQAWVISSNEVPGLAAKADTLEGLVSQLQTLVPKLLGTNRRV
jgi:predicted RNase H-like HicB family nuclease